MAEATAVPESRTDKPAINIEHLTKTYVSKAGERTEVLKDISLDVPRGSITAVVGPSGAGKTTLSKCISLLEQPSGGSIRVDGKDLSALTGAALRTERRAIGTIFQSSALLRRRTAAENVALPLEYLGVVQSEIDTRVHELLARVGIADKADFYPGQLSGGQKQRVGIARALALHPKVLLSDEATSGLDPDATRSILELLRGLRDELGLSIILITHEMDVVRDVADRVAAIDGGRIVEHGRVADIIADPDSALGKRLVNIKPAPLPAGADYAIDVLYGSGPDVAGDWISRLGTDLGVSVTLLASVVESVDGRPAGRVTVGISGNRTPEEVVDYLRGLGLHASAPAVANTPVLAGAAA